MGDRRLRYQGLQYRLLENFESDDLKEFRKNYVHMSTNPEEFELFCWERWFYLRNLMQRENINSVLYLDSDVLLYSSIEEIQEAYAGLAWDCGFAVAEDGAASGHVSYWTFDALQDFCSFVVRSFCEDSFLALYREKWDRHLAHNIPGGICDMTTLHLYHLSHPDRVVNMAESYRANVFDLNMNTATNHEPDEYVLENGIKKTIFQDNYPYFSTAKELVRVHALHFQGSAKRYIRSYYRGESFAGKGLKDLSSLARYCLIETREFARRILTAFR